MDDGTAELPAIDVPAGPESAGCEGRPTTARLHAELVKALPMLRAFARRALGADGRVEDLVQDALVAATAGLADYRGGARLSTWAVGILSHKIADHFRLTNRWKEQTLEDAESLLLLEAPPPDNPERRLEQREAMNVVEAALALVPERERLAVLLVDVNAAGHEEACHAMSVSATHLRVLLHRGRHRLGRRREC